MRAQLGRAGCGCLIFALIVLMIFVGILMHPASLRFLARLLIYSDRTQFSDVTFVPKTEEDHGGEIYLYAFEELRNGNSKSLLVEEFSFIDVKISELLVKVAKERGLKNGPISGIKLEGDLKSKAKALKDFCKKRGIKKVTVLVPDYSSRKYAIIFRDLQSNEINFLIKPVSISIFNRERWWKDASSRILFFREISEILCVEKDKVKETVLRRVSSRGG